MGKLTEDEPVIVGQKHVKQYDDGGESLSVSFDRTARYFADRVTIRANDSDDSTIYLNFDDLRWLAATLNEIDEVLAHSQNTPDSQGDG